MLRVQPIVNDVSIIEFSLLQTHGQWINKEVLTMCNVDEAIFLQEFYFTSVRHHNIKSYILLKLTGKGNGIVTH